MTERHPRRHPRVDWRGAVELVQRDGAHLAVSVNVSPGGMLVATDAKLRVGDQVMAVFRLPTMSADTEAAAEVRWSSNGSVGISFVGLRAVEVRAINRMMK